MKNLEVNTAFWCIFISVTLQAAVRLEKDYTEKSAMFQESTQEVFETVISSELRGSSRIRQKSLD